MNTLYEYSNDVVERPTLISELLCNNIAERLLLKLSRVKRKTPIKIAKLCIVYSPWMNLDKLPAGPFVVL